MRAALLTELREADEALRARGITPHSLRGEGELASSLHALGEQLWSQIPRGCEAVFCRGLASVLYAEIEYFPENLFWDLDFLAVNLLRDAERAALPADHLATACEVIVRLQRVFASFEIRFRYVHDFTYGFDWAKWVRRAPQARSGIGPFDLSFLYYTELRAAELLELIAEDDAKYPRLGDVRARNPFGFSREPEAEFALHRALAREKKIPVETWLPDAEPRWQLDFQRLRAERAAELGLSLA